VIEYHAGRWKMKAGFPEIRWEIGGAATLTRSSDAVFNHLMSSALLRMVGARSPTGLIHAEPVAP